MLIIGPHFGPAPRDDTTVLHHALAIPRSLCLILRPPPAPPGSPIAPSSPALASLPAAPASASPLHPHPARPPWSSHCPSFPGVRVAAGRLVFCPPHQPPQNPHD